MFGLLNIKAIQLVGGGAHNFQEWFNFLGLIKDKQPTRIGAPYQMDFPGEQHTPAQMTVMNETIPTCWDSAFKCSCGDCPDAPACIPVSPSAQNCTDTVQSVPTHKRLCMLHSGGAATVHCLHEAVKATGGHAFACA